MNRIPKSLIIYIDGASRGNPGHASYGISMRDEKENVVAEFNDYIGETTNSIAEYTALLKALEEAKKMEAQELLIYTDSQLVSRQFEGIYKIKHEPLKILMGQIRELEKFFKRVTVKHLLRSSHPGNKRADQLANIALNIRSLKS